MLVLAQSSLSMPDTAAFPSFCSGGGAQIGNSTWSGKPANQGLLRQALVLVPHNFPVKEYQHSPPAPTLGTCMILHIFSKLLLEALSDYTT